MINCIDHAGYRTPIIIKEKTLGFDIVNFWKCHTVLRGMAHLISVYKLNKAENQDDESKMFQIFKLEIYQLQRIGPKIYTIKTSPRSFSGLFLLGLGVGGRLGVLVLGGWVMVSIQLQQVIFIILAYLSYWHFHFIVSSSFYN